MNNFNRNKDLVKVFDERWKANNGNQYIERKNHEKDFNKRMFGNIKCCEKISNNPQDMVNRLNERINAQKSVDRISRNMDFRNGGGV